MSASDVIGDVAELKETLVPFSSVTKVTGTSGAGSFPLASSPGLVKLLAAHGTGRIVEDSLQCRIIGPVGADQAASAVIAVIPSTCSPLPDSISKLLTVPGHAFVKSSVYVPETLQALSFAVGAAHQLKPIPLVGDPPLVVYHYTILGGSQKSEAYIVISGRVSVEGVGFVPAWA